MLQALIAAALIQAPVPTPVQSVQGWRVAGDEAGCVAHAAYRGGTVLSVFALPGHDGIGFLLQNQAWADLEDEAVYPLDIGFEGGSQWALEAVASAEIDLDGPGLFFTVRPGAGDGGRDFMAEFAAARAMRIGHRGAPVATLALAGQHDATVALARCLSRLLSGAPLDLGSGEPPVTI